MPRSRKPARLWLEPEKRNADGSIRQKACWVIKDGAVRISTGFSLHDRERAEMRFHSYLAERHAASEPIRDKSADQTLCADVIRHYVENRGPHVADPSLLAYRTRRLLTFWGDKNLGQIDGRTCRQYAAHRHSEASARRELEDLRAAIRLYAADGLCRETVIVSTPGKSPSRTDFLTRDQVAELVWYLWRRREVQHGRATQRYPLRHLVPFVLTAVYTGTRSRRIWTASFQREEGLPWIDARGGVFYRSAQGEHVAPTKRAGSIRIPPRLLAHFKRWSSSRTYLVEYRGKPADPKKALAKSMTAVYGGSHPFVRHTFRHTCATWLMWSGEDLGDIAAYLSMTREMLMKVYGHEHPDADRDIGLAFNGRAGRRKAA